MKEMKEILEEADELIEQLNEKECEQRNLLRLQGLDLVKDIVLVRKEVSLVNRMDLNDAILRLTAAIYLDGVK